MAWVRGRLQQGWRRAVRAVRAPVHRMSRRVMQLSVPLPAEQGQGGSEDKDEDKEKDKEVPWARDNAQYIHVLTEIIESEKKYIHYLQILNMVLFYFYSLYFLFSLFSLIFNIIRKS